MTEEILKSQITDAVQFAQFLEPDRTTLPMFALLYTDDPKKATVNALIDPLPEPELHKHMRSLALEHKPSSVVLGVTALFAMSPKEDAEDIRAIREGLKSGTIPGMKSVPGSRPALILTHYTDTTTTTIAFPINDGQIGHEAIWRTEKPKNEAEPPAGINFF